MRGSRLVELGREYVEFKIETGLFKISVVHLIISLIRDGGTEEQGKGQQHCHINFLPLEVMTG